MLLIDGIKYELWTPPTEDDFERIVNKHTQEIFGEQSIYLDMKQKLKSRSGIGSIPDGYVIIFGDSPHWHIVEVELSSHPLHEHIVSQVSRFINGIKNPLTWSEIVGTIYAEITGDDFLKLKVKQAIGQTEVYKFLSDLISKPPVLTIIIEKETEGLREAISTLAYPREIKVVEFQTFVRERVGLQVHAHLFEPLYQPPPKKIIITEVTKEEITTTPTVSKRVTIKNLIDAGILKVGQVIYGWYRDQRYEARIVRDGKIKLAHNGSEYDSPSAAGTGILHYAVDGWTWWHTTKEDGTECLLAELREEYRRTHPSNP